MASFLQFLLKLYISHGCPSGLLFLHLQNELNEQRLTKHDMPGLGRASPRDQGLEAQSGLSHEQAPGCWITGEKKKPVVQKTQLSTDKESGKECMI